MIRKHKNRISDRQLLRLLGYPDTVQLARAEYDASRGVFDLYLHAEDKDLSPGAAISGNRSTITGIQFADVPEAQEWPMTKFVDHEDDPDPVYEIMRNKAVSVDYDPR